MKLTQLAAGIALALVMTGARADAGAGEMPSSVSFRYAVTGRDGAVTEVRGLVEKPAAGTAPSNLILPGRYILQPEVMDILATQEKGAGGEIQLTDAIALLIEEGHPVHVVVHRGARHDLGNPGGYLKAAVDFALERDDYGPELRRWLVERLGLSGQEG